MSDCISRQAAIDAICNACGKIDCDKMDKCEKLQLPPANCSEFPNNSDTISRAAAIDAAVEAADEWDGGYSRSREEIITMKLRMLPSANKSGHWVMNPSEVAGDGYYICSNCNNDVYDATDFCPNCGADMRGEQDGCRCQSRGRETSNK